MSNQYKESEQICQEIGVGKSTTKNDVDVVEVAVLTVIGVVLLPIVISIGVGVVNGVNDIRHKIKIKKGLKNGTIVEVDGNYYEVVEKAEGES